MIITAGNFETVRADLLAEFASLSLQAGYLLDEKFLSDCPNPLAAHREVIQCIYDALDTVRILNQDWALNAIDSDEATATTLDPNATPWAARRAAVRLEQLADEAARNEREIVAAQYKLGILYEYLKALPPVVQNDLTTKLLAHVAVVRQQFSQ